MITSNLLFCIKHSYEDDYFGVEHSHPCYEIVYYCEGEGAVSFSKKEQGHFYGLRARREAHRTR